MNEQPPPYFDLARSWADERDLANARSRRIAWSVAGVAVAVAVLQAVALALAMPLKSVVPVAVLVDRTTGHVERVNLDQMKGLTQDEALRQSLLAQYVVAREGYDPISISSEYRKVVRWSGGQARASYLTGMQQNPPSTRLGAARGAIGLDAQIRSVSMLGPNTAMVRYEVAGIDVSGGRNITQPFVATVSFAFRNRPMSIEERLDNPLGFEVTAYRVAPETAALTQPASAAEATPQVVMVEPASEAAAVQPVSGRAVSRLPVSGRGRQP